MLQQANRLPHTQRISKGKSFTCSFFLVKYTANDLTQPRFGIIISKKVDKRATVRNRIRRLLHQFIQDHLSDFPKGKDYLFIIHLPFSELTDELLLNLSNLIKQSSV